jgi:Flp pilus assembly pilin Flp
MKRFTTLFARLAKNDEGGEMLEYALIMGLLFVACMTAIAAVGTKVVGRWNSMNSSM